MYAAHVEQLTYVCGPAEKKVEYSCFKISSPGVTEDLPRKRSDAWQICLGSKLRFGAVLKVLRERYHDEVCQKKRSFSFECDINHKIQSMASFPSFLL
ncbi:hypothetical protein TNCV_1595271 [Trichonephila clavipes]|nr:hypothetical protein TNCV_1595271 [Trichonephila clavipes]